MWSLEGEPGGANEQMPIRGTAKTAGDHSIAVALGTVLIRATPQGEVVSRCELNQPVIGSPALSAAGLAIVHTRDGQVYGVDRSGRERWRTSVGEPLGWASPLIDGSGNCWIAGSRGGLLRLNDRGEQDRRPFFRSLQRFDCTGMIHHDTLYIGAEDGFVYAIDLAASKGRNRWNQSDDHGKANWFINGSILMRSEEEVVATGGDGTVFGFSLSGETIWSWSLSGKAIASARSCNASKPSGRLSCFDPEAGREPWRFDCPNPIESTPAIDDEGNVYFGDNAGLLYSVDRRGQERWRIELGSPIRSKLALHPTEGTLLVISDNARLTAIEVA
jgi:outer membrane protein assembly factor BamB